MAVKNTEITEIKGFNELSPKELYEILKARAEIFVVEQNCIYQDLDGIDERSVHVSMLDATGAVQAYLRIFQKTDESGVVQMGRVLSRKHGVGLGGEILRSGICAVKDRARSEKIKALLGEDISEIYIEAQKYAVGFYEREGFRVCSEEFIEDGIPHVQMRLKLS